MSENNKIYSVLIAVIAWSMPLFLFSGQAVIPFYILLVLYFVVCAMKNRHSPNLQSQIIGKSIDGSLYNAAHSGDDKKLLYKNPLFLFTIFTALSIFWSESPAHSGSVAVNIFLLSGLGFLALKTTRNFAPVEVNPKIFWPIFLSLIYMIIDHLSHYSISLFLRDIMGFSTDNIRQPQDKGTAIFVLLMPVFWLIMRPENWQKNALIFALLVAFITHPMQSAQLAVVAGFMALLMHKYLGTKSIFIIIYSAVFVLLLAPLIFGLISDAEAIKNLIPNIPDSWLQRIQMWEIASKMILEAPILGHGIASSRYAADIIQIHPHNNFLQIWLELGAVGALLVATILVMISAAISSIHGVRKQRAALMIFTSWLVFSQMSFGLWQKWWVTTILLVLIVMEVAFKNVKAKL